MAVIEVHGSVMSTTFMPRVIALLKARGHEVEFVPVGMAAGQQARCSSLDSFGEVPYVVEDDGGFKVADLNFKHEKSTGPVNVKALNILRSAALRVPDPVLVASSCIMKEFEELGVVVPKSYPTICVYPGVDSPSKYVGVESFDHVDYLQRSVEALLRHVKKAKYCCCFGPSKCMGVDSFEHSCVDVHACYKGTLPWLAPRGPRISKLSRTDTAAAAPAPSRPFSFRASLTVSLSVFFE